MKRVKEKNILTMRSRPEKVLFFFVSVLFAIYAFALIVPFLWLIVQSLEDPMRYDIVVMREGPFFFPEKLHFENYINAFSHMTTDTGITFFEMLLNSLWVVFLQCTYCMFWPVCVAYVLAKYKFPGRDLLYTTCIVCMIIPLGDVSGAYYKLVNILGIYDTGPLFDVLTCINGFGTGFNLVIYGIFKGISWDYAEAVYMDGGNDYTVFFRIMLPQAMPALSAYMVAGAITAWNAYEGILLYKPSNLTISAGLYKLEMKKTRYGPPLYYAGVIISIIPLLIVYMCSVGSMMKNLTIGGLKG